MTGASRCPGRPACPAGSPPAARRPRRPCGCRAPGSRRWPARSGLAACSTITGAAAAATASTASASAAASVTPAQAGVTPRHGLQCSQSPSRHYAPVTAAFQWLWAIPCARRGIAEAQPSRARCRAICARTCAGAVPPRMLRAFSEPRRRQHVVHVLLDRRVELLEHRQRQLRQVHLVRNRRLDRVGHGFMRVAEGQALFHQVVGQVGGGGVALAARRSPWPRA